MKKRRPTAHKDESAERKTRVRRRSKGQARHVSREPRLPTAPHPTKRKLLESGLSMLLQHGYNDLGIQALLEATSIPKGSFYHHFRDKEDFALSVIDLYMTEVHATLDACLTDGRTPPLDRVRRFFELTEETYKDQGYMGCLLGGLGQELSGVSDLFRRRIEDCFSQIAARIAVCLEEARRSGDTLADLDSRRMAALLVDCWEGAALRSRLRGDARPLGAMLDFYFQSIRHHPDS